MKHKLNIANAVTVSRIVFAVLVFFCATFSIQFYAFYLLGGFTDMIDGWVARKLNLKSSFGAKLDTIADYVSFIKLTNLVSSLVLLRRIVPIHTVMNKVTGFMLFLLPFGIGRGSSWQVLAIAVIATCSAATFAAIQEGHFICTGKEIE